MILGFFQRWSLKTRVTLFTLVIFLISIWSLAFYASRILRTDMERMLSEQQFSTVSFVATDANRELNERLRALEKVAARVAPVIDNAAALQAFLQDRETLYGMFNGGLVAMNLESTVIADVPLAAGRLGANYKDRDHIVAALKEGKSTIGKPNIGKILNAPVFGMIVPIHDAKGSVIGALMGVTDLGKPNFLENITESRYGKTGGYVLSAPMYRLIITATDKARIMETLPAPGSIPALDRFIQGYEGSAVYVNPQGVEVLASAKGVPVASWNVAAILPTAEAFAPLQDILQRMLLATICLTLLAGVLTWWMLRRQLAPMLAAVKTLASLSDAKQSPQPLPITNQDEIGDLIGGFNRLLETLAQREEALKLSQNNLAITLHSIGDAVIATDEAGRISRMNPTAERLSGWVLADALGRPLAEVFRIVNADTRESVADPVQLVMAHGQVVGLANHTLLLARDGREYQIADSAAPIRNDAGTIVGVVLVFSDVTEKYRTEVALRASEATLRENSALLRIAGGIARFGGWSANLAEGRVLWSDEVAAIHEMPPGYSPQLAEGLGYYAPEWRDRITEVFDACARDGTPYDEELEIITASGKRVWVRTIGKPIRDESGKIISVQGAFQDVTERKKEEEFRNKLTDLVPGVIYQYRLYPDGRSCFPYSSSGMNGIYEVTPEEVREDATPVFKRLHPEDLESTAAAIHDSAHTLALLHWEFRVVLPRQGLRWRMCDAKPERLPDGGTLWYGTITDITERKRAEKEKAMLEAQLQQVQKMESVGRLAGGVAHDFNNMLTVILGNVAMAIEQTDPTQPIYTDLNEIRKAANRSADLTRQLLAFARKQVVEPKVLDLNETIIGIFKMLERLIGEDISLKWLPGANLWPVKVDPSQIDQILANLCINARDAIAGVGNIVIETGNSAIDEDYCAIHAGFIPGEYVRISVSDNGHGIDKETLAHIFEPFFTTKGAGEGTGLGLATVYGAVKQNNGFVHVYSESDSGTTFTIYLPRYGGTAELEHTASATGPLVRGKETILLVEDEPSILKLTTRALTRQGYAVLAASTPREAIDLASEHTEVIHLLMTDVVMPEMNGRDLAKNLLAIHPKLKVLFMSGYTANIIVHQGVLDQGVQFIQKPFAIDDMAIKVREVLDSE